MTLDAPGDEVPEGLLEIGRIVKPHGIRGEVVVVPVTNRHERFERGSEHRTGDTTLVVASARRHQGNWVVAYEGVSDRNRAEALRSLALFGEPIDVLDPDEYWVHELVGSAVVDADGLERGRVVAVEVNPAHDLLVLDTGALVPVVFVVDASGERVLVDTPPGLFDETAPPDRSTPRRGRPRRGRPRRGRPRRGS